VYANVLEELGFKKTTFYQKNNEYQETLLQKIMLLLGVNHCRSKTLHFQHWWEIFYGSGLPGMLPNGQNRTQVETNVLFLRSRLTNF